MSEEIDDLENEGHDETNNNDVKIIPVSGLYENWFLDYASYVILERAVPAILDGLKPVQRRILHSLKEMDDGRFNKIANVIGNTMKYHPHGDAAIGDATVNLGQKELMIETQGNWGDVRTGDRAAAPRYIEGRLSKFALAVCFNNDTTEWTTSYDGRNKEPVHLPMKFPMLLAQGAEGIAVGLSTKILPHNFIELCEASIRVLQGKKTNILPDFPTGGSADFSDYNQGERGGKIRVRAKIEAIDKKTLLIKDVPFAVTTGSLVESIIKANDKGKIKIKKVVDNTAKDVEIQIDLPNGVSPDQTIDALYAFTDCEVSTSPNACVIVEDKPVFTTVNEILRISTENTVSLLKQELEIRLAELKEKIFFTSLLKIFINEGMYKNPEYENSGDLAKCYEVLNTLFEPFFKQFYRKIENEDYKKLIDKPLSSITRFDTSKVDEQIKALEEQIAEVQHHLDNLVDFAIAYFQNLIDKFGKGKERKTEISTFDTINTRRVAIANAKLYVNRKEGFVGTGLKKDEFIGECSDIDNIIAFTQSGTFKVFKVTDKTFVGKDVIHAAVWKKGDEHMVYNAAYLDGKTGKTYVKRFAVTSITRDKDYDVTKGTKGSKVLYFTANPNSESEIVDVMLSQGSKARVKRFDYDFAELAIKGRGSQGNTLTKYPVRKIVQKSVGKSTLGGKDLWYDETVGRFNTEERGQYLGDFVSSDTILCVYSNGEYEVIPFDLNKRISNHNLAIITKLTNETVLSAVHYDGEKKDYYVKRFQIETSTLDTKYSFICESEGSKLLVVSDKEAVVEFSYSKGRGKERQRDTINLNEFIDVKGWKAIGNKLSSDKVYTVKLKEEIGNTVEQKEVQEVETVEDKVVEPTPEQPKELEEKPIVVKKKPVEDSTPKEEKKVELEEKEKEPPKTDEKPQKEDDEVVKPGTTIDLDVKPKKKNDEDQLGLF